MGVDGSRTEPCPQEEECAERGAYTEELQGTACTSSEPENKVHRKGKPERGAGPGHRCRGGSQVPGAFIHNPAF